MELPYKMQMTLLIEYAYGRNAQLAQIYLLFGEYVHDLSVQLVYRRRNIGL
jgi:hypothetical protein